MGRHGTRGRRRDRRPGFRPQDVIGLPLGEALLALVQAGYEANVATVGDVDAFHGRDWREDRVRLILDGTTVRNVVVG